ncbi:MAG: TetR/AcrR family transcriptional regulator [Mycetocola sp.]
MASKGTQTRARLTESMLELIQTAGYSGTGVNDVVRHAAAPKGSIYFHFPDGKEGLGVAAVELAARQFGQVITEAVVSGDGPAAAVRLALDALSDLVSQSDYRLGCPVSVVTLEMGAESERLRRACATAFQSWITPTAGMLEEHGLSSDEATTLATVIVSAIEGSIIMARSLRSTQPITATATVLEQLVAQRCAAEESGA